MPGATKRGSSTSDTNHDRKRSEILEAAASVFWERGFSAGTTADVAGRVGLSQPTIYHYVGSKAVLLEEIVTEVHGRFLRSLEDARKQSGDPRQQLAVTVQTLTHAIAEEREMFAVFWQELRQLPAEQQERVRADERELLHEVERMVEQIQRDGGLAPGRSPAVVAAAILGMASWMYQWYRPAGPDDPGAIAATFLELIGIAPAEDGSHTD